MNKLITSLNIAQKIYKQSNKEVTRRLCTLVTKQKTETTVIQFDKNLEEIDWNKEINKLKEEDKKLIFEPCKEDLSHVAPFTKPTFNFAAYINKSETLQKLVHLGVDLHKIEKKKAAPEYILKLDFEKDIQKHIFFLHDLGVTTDDLGSFLTTNPYIFQEDLETLSVRINYLESKAFDKEMISRIVTKNPYWLMFSTKRIDARLGHFQKTFSLTGNEVRALATKQPKLITYNMDHIKLNTFSVKEEMGFEEQDIKKLLLEIPKFWMMSQKSILQRFDYIHSTMNISHKQIVGLPKILTCRRTRIQQRHQFLLKLGRAQYDPMKENYVSTDKLIEGTDSEFCVNLAKSSVETYNTFLKSL